MNENFVHLAIFLVGWLDQKLDVFLDFWLEMQNSLLILLALKYSELFISLIFECLTYNLWE